MPRKRPDFMNSPYFVDEPGNWHLKEGAPIQLQREFREYMYSVEHNHDKPASINGVHIDFPYER
ncbi:hypothetical protein [Bacillus massilinigeriensis]|uniref:hypothetical protein n=1 Tax=Bacillus massilionigeriensis TaxID=1805475 RepID=UPI00096B675A|nr:hypothetical protein [Bacillus massilionigeriensis]